MKTIELVTHCWRYSRVLNYQLASLYLHPTKECEVKFTIYHNWEDRGTVDVVNYFANSQCLRHGTWLPVLRDLPSKAEYLRDEFKLFWWPNAIELPKLLRRAIGRNFSAKTTDADIVWFCDCDYIFGEGALDALAAADLSTGKIFYPRITYYNKTHANGDEYARHIEGPKLADIDPADFIEHRPGKAIGGVQIVPGDVVREYGYCPDSKWQTPVTDGKWKDTKEDKVFRRILDPEHGKGLPLDIPNVFRIRQSQTGVVDSLEPQPSP